MCTPAVFYYSGYSLERKKRKRGDQSRATGERKSCMGMGNLFAVDVRGIPALCSSPFSFVLWLVVSCRQFMAESLVVVLGRNTLCACCAADDAVQILTEVHCAASVPPTPPCPPPRAFSWSYFLALAFLSFIQKKKNRQFLGKLFALRAAPVLDHIFLASQSTFIECRCTYSR